MLIMSYLKVNAAMTTMRKRSFSNYAKTEKILRLDFFNFVGMAGKFTGVLFIPGNIPGGIFNLNLEKTSRRLKLQFLQVAAFL